MDARLMFRKLAGAVSVVALAAGLAVVSAGPALAAEEVAMTINVPNCDDVHFQADTDTTGLQALLTTNVHLIAECPGVLATELKKDDDTFGASETVEVFGGGPELELDATVILF